MNKIKPIILTSMICSIIPILGTIAHNDYVSETHVEENNFKNNKQRTLLNKQRINSNNVLTNKFDVSYSNVAHSSNITFTSNKLIYSDDINKSKNKLINNYISENNFNSTNSVFDEFINGKLNVINNIYSIDLKQTLREFTYYKNCGKDHPYKRVCDSQNHIHNRGCTKTYYKPCTGCIKTTENLKYNINFSQSEFNDFLLSNTIDINSFDFSNLLKIDNNNSKKFINRNVLDFKFNNEYLLMSIINSYNKYFLDEFTTLYKSKISDKLFQAFYDAINNNKITNYKNNVISWMNINEKKYKKEHNVWYWIDSMNYKNENEITNKLNSLNSFSDYFVSMDNFKHNLTSKKLWVHLYEIFSNNSILQAIKYNITYKVYGKEPEIKTISMFDLINKNNTNISSYYDILMFDHSNEKEEISILNVDMESNTNNIDLMQKQCSFIDENENKSFKKIKPNLNDSNTWFVFNPNIIDKNIIQINEIDQIAINEFMTKNSFLDKLPSELVKSKHFIDSILSIKKSPFFSLTDKDLLGWIKNDMTTLESPYFNFYIDKIETNYDDFHGTIKLNIHTTDNQKHIINIKGLKKEKIKANIIYERIFLSSLHLKKLSDINKDFVINNLIGFDNQINDNTILSLNVPKNIFINEMLKKINILYSDKWAKITINFFDGQTNSNHEINHYVDDNSITSNDDENNIGNDVNNVESNNYTNKNNIAWIVSLSIISVILVTLSTYIISKKIIEKKGKNTIESKKH